MNHALRRVLLSFALVLVAACLPSLRPETPARTINAGERLLSEDFSHSADWSQFNSTNISALVRDGVYRLSSSQPGQYIWGTSANQYDNTIIQVEVNWQTDTSAAFAGIICRLHPDDGRGYYVVVSSSGDFSIRYIARNIDDPLVRWQSHPLVPAGGAFVMRVICVDDYIALYVDGQYIDGATDRRLNDGTIGLALGIPPRSGLDGPAIVEFDDLRIWRGSFP